MAAIKIYRRRDFYEFLLYTFKIGFEYKDANGQVSRYYYRKDIRGDIINILDNNGNIVVKYVYDAWGNHKVLDAAGTENTSDDFIGNINPIRYRGYYYDTETNLYYLTSRYYDPETGRFISPDHIGYALIGALEPNGLNFYAYCMNKPIIYSDPEGTIVGSALAFGVIGLMALFGLFVVYEFETTYHSIENAYNGLTDVISDAINSVDTSNDIDIAMPDVSIGVVERRKPNPLPPGIKGQGTENGNRARNDKNWKNMSNKRRPPKRKKHTPGRDHRHFIFILLELFRRLLDKESPEDNVD